MSGVRDVPFAQSTMNEPKPDFANTNSEAAATEAVNGASAAGTAAPEPPSRTLSRFSKRCRPKMPS